MDRNGDIKVNYRFMIKDNTEAKDNATLNDKHASQ